MIKGTRPGVANLLDYDGIIDNGIMSLYSGGFLAAWRIHGPDMDSISLQDSASLCGHLQDALSLPVGWTLQSDLIRDPVREYPANQVFPDAVSLMIDRERLRQFAGEDTAPTHFLGTSYFCLTYHPVHDKGKRGREWLFETSGGVAQAERDLRMFRQRVDQIDYSLASAFSGFKGAFSESLRHYTRLGRRYDRLSEYVSHCITGEFSPIALPTVPTFLNYRFAFDFLPGRDMRINDKHLSVLVVEDFPEASFAGIMRCLEMLAFPVRYTQQAQCMDKEEAEQIHSANQSKWQLTGRSWFSSLFGKGQQGQSDHIAMEMSEEARRALADARHNREKDVHYSAKLIIRDESLTALADKVRHARQVLRDMGFQSRVETVNASRALFSSFPGHALKEKRLCPATVTNFSHMMPVSTPYRGDQYNESRFMPPGTPPLFYADTIGQTPYRFNLHVGDVGHTLVGGPTGSGKTTLLLLTIAQWFRFPQAQVFAFDKKKTLYTLTKAMGGDYYTLSPEGPYAFCPLAQLETKMQRSRAVNYIDLLCSLMGLDLTPELRNDVDEKLLLLSDSTKRSLTDFQSLIGASSPTIADALQHFTIGSAASGGILDSQQDTLTLSRFAVFELDELYEMDPRVTSAVLFHIFDKIHERLDPTVPTLVSVDELRASLDQPLAVKRFGEYLIEGRKNNMALMLLIQEMGKLMESPLKNTVNQSCFTRVYLANAAAKTTERKVYEDLQCTEIDIELISDLKARQYYVCSPNGRRTIDLALGRVALAMLTRSSKQDREMVNRLIAKHGDGWVQEWLRLHNCEDWIEFFNELLPKGLTAYA